VGIAEIAFDADVAQAEEEVRALCADADSGDGVMILTDLYGATPSNVACGVLSGRKAIVVSGLNLAMLIRAFNYSHLSITELRDKLREVGEQSVVISEPGRQS